MTFAEDKALALTPTTGLPEEIADTMAQDSAMSSGLENMTPEDISIPFLTILQALSPQLRGEKKIDGAAEGLLINTVSSEIIKPPATVIPCAFKKVYVEWAPGRNGNYRGQHGADILPATTRDDQGNIVLDNGNFIVPTAYHFCLLITAPDHIERVVIGLSRTQIKASRRWNSQMSGITLRIKGKAITPPTYSHTYQAGTELEKNDKGSWYGWTFRKPTLITDPEIYQMARRFHNDVSADAVTAAPPPETAAGEGSPDAAAKADNIGF